MIALTFATIPATADDVCVDALCAGAYDEGQDCDELQAYGARGQYVAYADGNDSAGVSNSEYCFPTREGGVVSKDTAVHADVAGASAGASVSQFTDRYWGEFEWRAFTAETWVVAPTGHEVRALHTEAGFAHGEVPEPPYCYTFVGAGDMWLGWEGCIVAPWLMIP